MTKTDRYVECLAAGMKYRLIPITEEIIRCVIAKDEVKTEVAIRMFKRGNCSLEEIANDTQLSLEQIKKIKEEL